MLERLNGSNYDPEIIDRTLEWGEALECLKRVDQGIVISEPVTENDYMMQGYQDYLQEHEPDLDISLLEL